MANQWFCRLSVYNVHLQGERQRHCRLTLSRGGWWQQSNAQKAYPKEGNASATYYRFPRRIQLLNQIRRCAEQDPS